MFCLIPVRNGFGQIQLIFRRFRLNIFKQAGTATSACLIESTDKPAQLRKSVQRSFFKVDDEAEFITRQRTICMACRLPASIAEQFILNNILRQLTRRMDKLAESAYWFCHIESEYLLIFSQYVWKFYCNNRISIEIPVAPCIWSIFRWIYFWLVLPHKGCSLRT